MSGTISELELLAECYILFKVMKWLGDRYETEGYALYLALTRLVAAYAKAERVRIDYAWSRVKDAAAKIISERVFEAANAMEAFMKIHKTLVRVVEGEER